MTVAATRLPAQDFSFSFEHELGDPAAVSGAPGAEIDFQVSLVLTSANVGGDEGPQGWSLGVSNVGVDVTDVTTMGTVAADTRDGGIRDGGFEVTGIVDPEKNGGTQGLTSAIVLSFTQPITIPANQSDVVAFASYKATVGDSDSEATIEFANGLVGEGQPVDTT